MNLFRIIQSIAIKKGKTLTKEQIKQIYNSIVLLPVNEQNFNNIEQAIDGITP